MPSAPPAASDETAIGPGPADDNGADAGNAQYRGCKQDSDCVAVPRVGCCNNGWLEAVSATQKDAYAKSFVCPTPRPMCPMYIVHDTRTPKCDPGSHPVQPWQAFHPSGSESARFWQSLSRRRDAIAMKLGLLAFSATMLVAGRVEAAASVWAVDDGEKIRRDATDTPFERGVDNAVWQPGRPVRLFAMRNESVAMQVVVEAGPEPLDAVTVDLGMLDGPDHAHISDVGVPLNAVGRPVERFVEHFVNVRRASGGKTKNESLGWEPGSGPPQDAWVGPVPDALIPVEHAPTWDAYPMHVEPRTNAIVWIDINVPRDQHAGIYFGEVRVQAGRVQLAALPVELEVADAMLPDRTVDAMVFYDHEAAREKRVGGGAEQQLWELLHAHRVAALHDATEPVDVQRQRAALDGSLYMPARGYLGPAPGLGDGVLAFGAYGALGDPDEAAMSKLEALADEASDLVPSGAADVFLYAADERCSSPRARAWRQLIAASHDPAVQRVRVAWTCSQDPSAQPVDVAMLAASWDPAQVKEARDQGKQVWEYNGELPRSGTFLLDADAVSPRVDGWLQAIYGIPRWFYWDAAHWNDRHDTEPVDPYEDPETCTTTTATGPTATACSCTPATRSMRSRRGTSPTWASCPPSA